MKNLGIVGGWYIVHQIEDYLYWVNEPGHVSFFIFKNNERALFIDSGLGLSDLASKELLEFLSIRSFDVICTHAHCDHVGLNYLAKNIYISEIEWKKYNSQNEFEQLGHYFSMLKMIKQWPNQMEAFPATRKWVPTRFINPGEIVSFERFRLEVIASSGHTIGSLMFLDLESGNLFTGDILYTGTMYLHLKDSDRESFRRSLNKILELQHSNTKLVIWPSHNKIPLPKDFTKEVSNFLDTMDSGLSEMITKEEEKNEIFEDGINVRVKNISITFKRGK